MKKLLIACLFTLLALPACAYRADSLKLSLWGEAAFAVPENNLDDISGADLGIGSSTENLTGLQFDFIFAQINNRFTGAQLAWIAALAGDFTGAQGALYARADGFTGAQIGFINQTVRTGTGAQLGLLNIADSVTGAQLGFVNAAQYASGLQLGLVNYAKTIDGLQVGLINAAGNGWLPVMVFLNGRF